MDAAWSVAISLALDRLRYLKYWRLTAQAAVTGDRELARKALLAHPLIGQYAIAEELVERLLQKGVERLRGAA